MSKNSNKNALRKRLENHGGRFVSITVRRAGGVTSYCARGPSFTPSGKSLRFYDVNAKRSVTVPVDSLVG